MKLTVVIPTLNAAETLAATLSCFDNQAVDVVVVDGGSNDDTITIAAAHGAKVMQTSRGRGLQLACGACANVDEHGWYLFLHADTVLSPDWGQHVQKFVADPACADKAAVFRFSLDYAAWQARLLEKLVDWRSRWFGLPYGDQGLLISRALYLELGGFTPIPLMEDVDIIRRIGIRRLRHLPCSAVTSAVRWVKGGWWLRSLRNLSCLCLYSMGVSAHTVHRLYRGG
jgi:rSAM/selenodomain-associated transferase 2